MKPLQILVIPDTQCKPGVPQEHLDWAGKAIVDIKPDVVVHLGDHWDMPSLSSHDKVGSKYFEGKRYKCDIEAGNGGMKRLLTPLRQMQATQKRTKHKVYRPKLHFLLGNHETRIARAISNNPMLEGLMSYDQLDTTGWTVHPFLVPLVLNGVAFSHYFPVGAMRRPAGTAAAVLSKLHMSAVAGHQQGRQVAYGQRADGKRLTAIIAGSYYLHDEGYLDNIGNKHWHGLLLLNEVVDGEFDECFLRLDYLRKKYGQ